MGQAGLESLVSPLSLQSLQLVKSACEEGAQGARLNHLMARTSLEESEVGPQWARLGASQGGGGGYEAEPSTLGKALGVNACDSEVNR